MNQRGHLLLLLLMVLAALALSSALVATRVGDRIEARQTDEVRMQALWLARSALDAGASGVHQVQTPLGLALVRVTADGRQRSVRVDLASARAVVSSTPAMERYEGPATLPP